MATRPTSELVEQSAGRNEDEMNDTVSNVSPESHQAKPPRMYTAPRTPTEEKLCRLFADVLSVSAVGVYDSFFDLGGDSLKLLRLFMQVRERFEKEPSFTALLETPTVEALARSLELDTPEADGIAIPSADRTPPLPLSFAQSRLFFYDQLVSGGATFYNLVFALRLGGRLDLRALRLTLTEIVRRHEALRTTFPLQHGQPVQRIESASKWELLRVHEAGGPEVLEKLASQEAERPLDVVNGPLLRATLLPSSPEEHVLLLTIHHIAADEWSMDVLYREMATIYSAYLHGRPHGLPPLPTQYADYAVWQRDWLAGDRLNAQIEYWKGELRGAPALLELPTDRPRPPIATYAGRHHRHTLPPGLVAKLHELARSTGSTLFMTLMASFQAFLSRHSGQSDVVIGFPIANRMRSETKNLIGFFVNMMALRATLTEGMTFAELAAQTKARALGAYAHQDLPFERLVEELNPPRDMGRAPIFQVVFVMGGMPTARAELEGLTMSPLRVETGRSEFDLLLRAVERPEVLELQWEYKADLFDEATIVRFGERLQTLLEQVTRKPEVRVSDVELLTEDERRLVLGELDVTRPSLANPRCLHQLFEEHVRRTPAATAVVFQQERLTYRELDERAERLACRLQSLGVVPDQPVGICLERSLELVVGLLAILKAGGAYLPLDPAYPKERLAFMLEDSQAAVILTQEKLVPLLPHSDRLHLLRLDNDGQAAATPNTARRSEVRPSNLAYIIYTSGSTGKPKGVTVAHHAVVRLFEATDELFHFKDTDIWVLFHSYSFDYSVWELWGALLFGGRVVVVPFVVTRSPSEFCDLLVREGVTVLNQTPSSLYSLMPYLYAVGSKLDALRYVVLAAEALDFRRLREWFRHFPEERTSVINMYGITETTVMTAHHRVRADDLDRGSLIGRGLPHLRLYVLDPQMRPQPVGVWGEVYVGGEGLAEGYLNRAELTRERFLPDPFSSGGRLYRTGDVCRLLSDGNLEYLGRLDQQVKIRGFRIELGEIEFALRSHQAVRDAIVLCWDSAGHGQRLVAYVAYDAKQERPVVAELKAHLRSKLPDYMVPGGFVLLEKLPMTPNGKADKKALLALDETQDARSDRLPPRTPTEETVCALFREVLGIASVGVRDSFFDLGGHSLLAIRLLSRIRSECGKKLPLRVVFVTPTVEGIAAALEELGPESGRPTAPAETPHADSTAGDVDPTRTRAWFSELATALEGACRPGAVSTSGALVLPPAVDDLSTRADDPGPLPPLSFEQEEYYIDFLRGRKLRRITFGLRLRGPLDVSALRQCFGEISRRHEVLRTTVGIREGLVGQRVRPWQGADLYFGDLSERTDFREAVDTERRAAARKRLDIYDGPMMWAKLLRLGHDDHALLLTVHHMALDAVACSLLARECVQLYDAFSVGGPIPPARPSLLYRDYARSRRNEMAARAGEYASYWRTKLLEPPAPRLELPTDRPRAGSVPASASLSRALGREVVDSLRELAKQNGTTLFGVLLPAVYVTLWQKSGQRDVSVVGSFANRDAEELQSLVGLCATALVLRLELSEAMTVSDLIRATREVVLEAQEHQSLPPHRIVGLLGLAPEELRVAYDAVYPPCFVLLLQKEPPPAQRPASGKIRVERLPHLEGLNQDADDLLAPSDDLAVIYQEQDGGGLSVSLDYRSDLFDRSRMESLIETIGAVLNGFARAPAARLAGIGDGQRPRQVGGPAVSGRS
jgi:amino acid adenylation domain-containing protein